MVPRVQPEPACRRRDPVRVPSLLLELPSVPSQVRCQAGVLEVPDFREVLGCRVFRRLPPLGPWHTRAPGALSPRGDTRGSTRRGECRGWCRRSAGRTRRHTDPPSRRHCSPPLLQRGRTGSLGIIGPFLSQTKLNVLLHMSCQVNKVVQKQKAKQQQSKLFSNFCTSQIIA